MSEHHRGSEEPVSKLSSGWERLAGEYEMWFEHNAKHFSLTTPRRVSLPLLPKVKQELVKMGSLGVILKVEEPMDWCVSMVVVPKPDGTVRICVDLTKLNNSVKRERHILPAVEHTLGQLGWC